MGLMDKVKGSIDRAREGVSDLAETTRIKYEISKLNDRRNALLAEIGKQVFDLHAQGRGVAEVEAQCKAIDDLDVEIKKKGEEIVRINTDSGSHTQGV